MQPLTQAEVLEKIYNSESFKGFEIEEIDFTNFTFENDVNFSGAKFMGKADFSGATYKGEANFNDTKFENGAYFSIATFTGDANFSEATYTGEAYFSLTTFMGDANFSEATYTGEANFSRAKFTGKADFSGATYMGEANFDDTKFDNEANFSVAKFTGEASFWRVKFTDEADFGSATFIGLAFFIGATYTGEAYFSGVKFNAEADFSGAKFTGKADFSRAKFTGEADFSKATFTGDTKFCEVKFENKADFSETTFENKANFSEATFTSEAYFQGSEDNLIFSSKYITDFRNITFYEPEKIRFNTVCFEKCLIRNRISDLSKIGFYNIKWQVKNKKRIIYDELENTKINYEYLKKTYSELVKNYEDKRSFEEAEDFYYREMEMKRLSKNILFQWISLLSIYKLLSLYGQSVKRTILLLFLLVGIIFPLCYLFSGIENKKTNRKIEYDISNNIQSISIPVLKDDYWDTLDHSVAVSTLKREKKFESITTSGDLFEGLQIVLISIQVALCVLAIRRSFRR